MNSDTYDIIWPPPERVLQIITVHPALRSVCLLEYGVHTTLVLRDEIDIFEAPPLLMDMFLTQPPQKEIELRCADDCSRPEIQDVKLVVEEGIRLRDLVGKLKEVSAGVGFDLVLWEFYRAVPRDHEVVKEAFAKMEG